MSNEEQDLRNVERSAEPDLVDPDSVVLDEGTISAEALEPELTVSPETLDLQEPTLGAVEISREIADAASLEDAAAEARAVAEEAEKAGTLVGGPMPTDTPTAKAAPAGTAPAGGTAGDMHRGAPGVGPEGSTARPDTDSRNVPAGPADVPSPEEVLADAMTGTTEDATPHPEPEEVLADVTTGTTEDATPHPEPEEVLTESRERASGGSGAEALLEDDAAMAVAPGGEAGVGPVATDRGDTAGPTAPVVAADGSSPAAPPSPADPGMRSRGSTTAAGSSGRSGSVPLLLIVVGGVVALGLVVWLAVSLLGGGGSEGSAEQTYPAALSYSTGVQAQADQHVGGAAGPSVRR